MHTNTHTHTNTHEHIHMPPRRYKPMDLPPLSYSKLNTHTHTNAHIQIELFTNGCVYIKTYMHSTLTTIHTNHQTDIQISKKYFCISYIELENYLKYCIKII